MNAMNNLWMHPDNSWIRERCDPSNCEHVDLSRPPCLGSILADGMGLGKTLTTLALIVKTSNQAQDFGTHVSSNLPVRCRATLVICPVATLTNWENEIKLHFTNESIPYQIFHGRGRGRIKMEELMSALVVLTTYDIIGTSGNPLHTHQITIESLNIEWYRIVLDEAQ